MKGQRVLSFISIISRGDEGIQAQLSPRGGRWHSHIDDGEEGGSRAVEHFLSVHIIYWNP